MLEEESHNAFLQALFNKEITPSSEAYLAKVNEYVTCLDYYIKSVLIACNLDKQTVLDKNKFQKVKEALAAPANNLLMRISKDVLEQSSSPKNAVLAYSFWIDIATISSSINYELQQEIISGLSHFTLDRIFAHDKPGYQFLSTPTQQKLNTLSNLCLFNKDDLIEQEDILPPFSIFAKLIERLTSIIALLLNNIEIYDTKLAEDIAFLNNQTNDVQILIKNQRNREYLEYALEQTNKIKIWSENKVNDQKTIKKTQDKINNIINAMLSFQKKAIKERLTTINDSQIGILEVKSINGHYIKVITDLDDQDIIKLSNELLGNFKGKDHQLQTIVTSLTKKASKSLSSKSLVYPNNGDTINTEIIEKSLSSLSSSDLVKPDVNESDTNSLSSKKPIRRQSMSRLETKPPSIIDILKVPTLFLKKPSDSKKNTDPATTLKS